LHVLDCRQTRALASEDESERPWAIHGQIVTDNGAAEGWLVFDRGGVMNVACPASEIPKNARRIEYDGFVFPALINTHDHAS